MAATAPLHRPQLSSAARSTTFTVDAIDEAGTARPTRIAGEHPLTLRVDQREVVTLMTLGGAPEALAIGYLRNQRLVDSIAEIASVQVDWESGSAAVTTCKGIAHAGERLRARSHATGCGQGSAFGSLMAEVDSITLPANARLRRSTLYALLEEVRRHEAIHRQAGAVHSCALASNEDGRSRLLCFVEDVGRHNAVDAIAGQMWLDHLDGGDKIFYTTGRLTSEIVIKAAQMGIPFVVSRSGLTQMAHAIAQRLGMTMIGRAADRQYLLFTGAERFDPES